MSLRPANTILEQAVARVGLRRGMKAVAFMVAWGVAADALGHPPGDGRGATAAVEEYAAWWRQPLRTAWYEWVQWREVFPEEESPQRLLEAATAAGARDVGSLRAGEAFPA